jgi:hypothetical protein
MAEKTLDGKYRCTYCGKIYSQPVMADACLEKHDLIYVPISRPDLGRLIQFIHLKQDTLLTESLLKSLLKYNTLKGKSK